MAGDPSPAEYERLRLEMTRVQLRGRGIVDDAVLRALSEIPREEFVPTDARAQAYDDGPLVIGHGQTISQPYIVARMLEALRPQSTDNALDVGTGSGYAAAALSRIVRRVYSVERVPELAASARTRLQALGVENVSVTEGDGAAGLPSHAPYQVIAVAAVAPRIPEALLAQLAVGGRMVIPVREGDGEVLLRVLKTGVDAFETVKLCAVRFVPLISPDFNNA